MILKDTTYWQRVGMATHVNRMPVFKSTTSESWTSYAERLQFFFKGNKIAEDEQKHALLLSSFEPSTFDLMKSLVCQIR